LAAKLSDLYREIVTTSVRFDELQRSTDKVLARVEATVEQLSVKVAAIHDDHVREKAALEAQIATLQARLTVLSEQALHAVVREVAREAVAGVVRDQVAAKLDAGKAISDNEGDA
jgi:hypothetical protein